MKYRLKDQKIQYIQKPNLKDKELYSFEIFVNDKYVIRYQWGYCQMSIREALRETKQFFLVHMETTINLLNQGEVEEVEFFSTYSKIRKALKAVSNEI